MASEPFESTDNELEMQFIANRDSLIKDIKSRGLSLKESNNPDEDGQASPGFNRNIIEFVEEEDVYGTT